VSITLHHTLALLVKAQPTAPRSSAPYQGRDRAARCAIAGSRGELWVRPAADPKRAVPHLHLHLTELAGVPVLPAAPHRAGTAGHGGHRAWPRRSSPAFSLPHPSPGTGPLGPKAPPPPVPGRPLPAVGRNLAGPPLPGHQGLHCKRKNLFRGLTAKG
jgi:hypothetical protein